MSGDHFRRRDPAHVHYSVIVTKQEIVVNGHVGTRTTREAPQRVALSRYSWQSPGRLVTVAYIYCVSPAVACPQPASLLSG